MQRKVAPKKEITIWLLPWPVKRKFMWFFDFGCLLSVRSSEDWGSQLTRRRGSATIEKWQIPSSAVLTNRSLRCRELPLWPYTSILVSSYAKEDALHPTIQLYSEFSPMTEQSTHKARNFEWRCINGPIFLRNVQTCVHLEQLRLSTISQGLLLICLSKYIPYHYIRSPQNLT